jgi:hypothetical protein
MNGMSLEEVKKKVKDEELSKETIASTLAAADVDKQMKKSMEGTVKVLEKLSQSFNSKQMAGLTGLMTDRGLGMGMNSIGEISKQGIDAYVRGMGIGEAEAK